MEDYKTKEETCYQCGKPECEGKDLEWCPTTNIWHDASDKALTEMYGAGSINITDGLGELQEPNYKSAFDAVCARNRELRAELATTRTALTTAEAERAEAVNALHAHQDQIRGWGIYRHYKGGRYKVLASSMNEANGETMVLYLDLASRQQYTRPEKEFFEEVAPGTPRFAIELPSDCTTCTTPGECKKGGQGNG